MKVENLDYVLNQIVEQLKPADPYKVVLFGSYAKGTATKDSDIDLMVILDNFKIETTSAEKFKTYIDIRDLLANIHYPKDVLIYSRAEYNQINEGGSYFFDEIARTGRILYEKGN